MIKYFSRSIYLLLLRLLSLESFCFNHELKNKLKQVHKETHNVVSTFNIIESLRIFNLFFFILVNKLLLTELCVEIEYLLINVTVRW